MRSQCRILNGEFPELLEDVSAAEPGIWIGHKTRLHPTAHLEAPVYIGANCDIRTGVRLGPNAVIECESLLGTNVSAANSLVLSSSSVGAGMELSDAIVCGGRVYNARFNAAIDICDDVLLRDRRAGGVSWQLFRLPGRIAAVMLILMFWLPTQCLLWLGARWSGKLKWQSREFVQTSAPSNHYMWSSAELPYWSESSSGPHSVRSMWRDLLYRIVPGLPAVALGRLRLVGVSPRSTAELQQLPPHWKDQFLTAATGLVSESLIQLGPFAPPDPRCVADSWHSAAHRQSSALLLLRYVKALLFGLHDFLPANQFVISCVDESPTKSKASTDGSRHPVGTAGGV